MADQRDVIIRPATVSDLPACAAIINAYIDATDWLPRTVSHEAIAAMFGPEALDRRRIWVACDATGVAGYASLDPDNRFLHALYLRAGLEGRGIGKQLLDTVKAAFPDGLELTVWEPNRVAQRFYGREGFVERPERRNDQTDDGVPTLLMRWDNKAGSQGGGW
jgi:putative acetyltransferase